MCRRNYPATSQVWTQQPFLEYCRLSIKHHTYQYIRTKEFLRTEKMRNAEPRETRLGSPGCPKRLACLHPVTAGLSLHISTPPHRHSVPCRILCWAQPALCAWATSRSVSSVLLPAPIARLCVDCADYQHSLWVCPYSSSVLVERRVMAGTPGSKAACLFALDWPLCLLPK